MTGTIEEAPTGYPGFLVMRPPRIAFTSATLKRVALAKLSDITLLSAAFGGERVLFQPWLTPLVDHGRGAFLTGCTARRTRSNPAASTTCVTTCRAGRR